MADSLLQYIFKVAEVSDTVLSILEEKKIVSLHRLLMVPTSTLETLLSEHYGDLLAVLQARRWIEAYRSQHEGKFPIKWEEEFTAVSFQEFETAPRGNNMFHTPKSQMIPTSWQITHTPETEDLRPSLIHMFAKLSSSSGARFFKMEYIHFEINSGADTMGDLLNKLTHTLRCNDQLPTELMLDLQADCSVDVFTYNSPLNDFRTRVRTTVGASCSMVAESCNKYVNFVLKRVASQHKAKVSLNNVLMASQAATVLPKKFVAGSSASVLSFPKQIFNFLVNSYEDESLGVKVSQMDSLIRLTNAIRNALQYLHGRVNQERFPRRFRHAFERYDKRDRSKSTSYASLANALSFGVAQATFLATERWKGFHDDIIDLHLLIESEQGRLVADNRRVRQQQSQVFTVADHLGNKQYIEGQPRIGACYEPLQLIVDEKDEYEHIFLSKDEIDKWYPARSSSEPDGTGRQRRKRFRDDLVLRVPVGTVLYKNLGPVPLIFILWKLPIQPSDRCVTRELKCTAEIIKSLPEYCHRCQWASFQEEFGYQINTMGCVPTNVLRVMHRRLTGDATASRDMDAELRVLAYLLNEGKTEFWPDLRAALNGSKQRHTAYFKCAEELLESITGASPYRHGEVREFTSEQKDMVSIPSLHDAIRERMQQHDDPTINNAPVPCLQLLHLSMCPRYPSRLVSMNFSSRLNVTRGIQQATMRKKNIDSHYNNAMNVYCNSFIMEVNKLVRDEFPDLIRPFSNGLILVKGAIKISLDDKNHIPLGEPGYPVRTTVRKMNAKLLVDGEANTPYAVDHDFHRANIRPSVCLIIEEPEALQGSWRNGTVLVSLKEGATQPSNGMRHAVELTEQIKRCVASDNAILIGKDCFSDLPVSEQTSLPFVTLLRTDGGSDHNPKNA